MPDTEQNQTEYPQLRSQAEGLGFPILRAVALSYRRRWRHLAVMIEIRDAHAFTIDWH